MQMKNAKQRFDRAREASLRAIATSMIVSAMAASATSPVQSPVPPPRHADARNSGAVQRSLPMQFNCTDTIKPTTVVISGAVTARSVRPKDGSDQIDKQIAALQSFAQSKGGRVIQLERLRAARHPETERSEKRSEADKLPFLQLQKVEVELPIAIDIDDALERVLKLGVDRYGKDVRVDGYDQSREFRNLTSYRVSDLGVKLARIAEQCVDAEIKRVCSVAMAKTCANAVNWTTLNARALDVANSYGSRTDKTLRIQRGSAAQTTSDALAEDERLELLSAATVRIRIQGYASVLSTNTAE
jgi:hypothetical protein